MLVAGAHPNGRTRWTPGLDVPHQSAGGEVRRSRRQQLRVDKRRFGKLGVDCNIAAPHRDGCPGVALSNHAETLANEFLQQRDV
jgi:hypothetical protein